MYVHNNKLLALLAQRSMKYVMISEPTSNYSSLLTKLSSTYNFRRMSDSLLFNAIFVQLPYLIVSQLYFVKCEFRHSFRITKTCVFEIN